MKQLRILTGRHAGTHLNLTSTRWQISADDEADIQLLDWTSDPVVIEVEGEDMLRCTVPTSGNSPAPGGESSEWPDFAPRRFGDVVLCAGPADGPWPADVELIAALTAPLPVSAPVAAPAAVRRRPSPLLLSAFVGTALMTGALGAAVAHLAQDGDRAAAADPAAAVVPLSLKQRLERALAGGLVDDLEIQGEGDSVVVRGLLRDASDAEALRQRLAAFRGERVVPAYAVVTEVAQSIGEALGQPGLQIRYSGAGQFVVSGEVDQLETLRNNAARVAADLAPLVRGVQVDATQRPASSHAPLSASLNAQGLQYVQTRDGVKHLSVSVAEYAPLADAPAR